MIVKCILDHNEIFHRIKQKDNSFALSSFITCQEICFSKLVDWLRIDDGYFVKIVFNYNYGLMDLEDKSM